MSSAPRIHCRKSRRLIGSSTVLPLSLSLPVCPVSPRFPSLPSRYHLPVAPYQLQPIVFASIVSHSPLHRLSPSLPSPPASCLLATANCHLYYLDQPVSFPKKMLNPRGLIPRGLPRVRHTGGSRYPESPAGFRVRHGMTDENRSRYPAACRGVAHRLQSVHDL
jgi:hypothetical protein